MIDTDQLRSHPDVGMAAGLRPLADEIDALRAQLAEAHSALAEATAAAQTARADHEGACVLVAKMHGAVVGEGNGPRRGVVEDVVDVVARAEKAEAQVAALRAFAEQVSKTMRFHLAGECGAGAFANEVCALVEEIAPALADTAAVAARYVEVDAVLDDVVDAASRTGQHTGALDGILWPIAREHGSHWPNECDGDGCVACFEIAANLKVRRGAL